MIRAITLTLGLISLSTVSFAQTITAKWATKSRPLFLHTEMESLCDNNTARAVATWNSASSFQWDFNQRGSLTGQRAQGDPIDRTTIELGGTGTALAVTNKYITPSNNRIIDADIVFNKDIYYFSPAGSGNSITMWCDPLPQNSDPYYSKYDYQSILAHELGHALGFIEYYGDDKCVMYYRLEKGRARRDLCAGERKAVGDAYYWINLPPDRGGGRGGIF